MPRCKKEENVRITPRDIRILQSVAENQFLTTSQISFLHFPSIHRGRKRLRILAQNDFLKRTRLLQGFENLAAEAIYYIGRPGLQVLTAHGVLSDMMPIPKLTFRPGSFMFLSHTLMRNSFRIALECSLRLNPIVSLHDWKHDNSITQRVLIPNPTTQSLERIPLRADAHFQLKKNERITEFYLEVDNGTTPLTRLVSKLKAYNILRRTQIIGNYVNQPKIRILVLMFSEKRAKNLIERLRKYGSTNFRDSVCLIASCERDKLLTIQIVEKAFWFQLTPQGISRTSLSNEIDNKNLDKNLVDSYIYN